MDTCISFPKPLWLVDHCLRNTSRTFGSNAPPGSMVTYTAIDLDSNTGHRGLVSSGTGYTEEHFHYRVSYTQPGTKVKFITKNDIFHSENHVGVIF